MAASAQLALPTPLRHDETGLRVARLDRPGWSRLTFTLDGRSMAARWSVGPEDGEVLLDAREPGHGQAACLRLFLRRRPCFLATVQTDSPAPVHWGMGARPRDRADFFAYAARWGARALGGERSRYPAFVRALEAELLERLRAPAAAVLAGLDREDLAAARRFSPALRVRVFGALARDERGWIRQSLSAGVGHLLFAFALMDRDETVGAGVKLVHDLADGRRLNAALDDAVAAWAEALPAWGRAGGGWNDDEARAFRAAAGLRGEAAAGLRGRQRLLVRRAGPNVEPSLLLLPPPLRFAPEDVPRTPGANAAWYRVMKVARVTVEAAGMRHPVPFLEAFSAFASRHAPAIARPPRGVPLWLWLDGLCEALRAGDRTPSRATDPARLRAEVDVGALRRRPPEVRRPLPPLPSRRLPPAADGARGRDGATRNDARGAGGAGGAVSRTVLVQEVEHILCPPTFDDWKEGEVTVRQVWTLRQLRAEGKRMANCVASYREAIEAGQVVVLHAEVREEPLCISLRRAADRWSVCEVKGRANRLATAGEWLLLLPFFDAQGILVRSGGR